MKLSDYLGKRVLLCFFQVISLSSELLSFQRSLKKYPEFQKLGVEVLSMSIDSMFVHKMWDDEELSQMVKGEIPFPIVV